MSSRHLSKKKMYSFSVPAKRVVKRIAWIGAWVTLLVGGPAFVFLDLH